MTDSNPHTAIPDTNLTERLKTLWKCADGGESWEDWYRRHSLGGSSNGRAVAAVLFDRARLYWPDFFSPTDAPAVAVWAEILDDNPFITPSLIEQAVDAVCAAGIPEPGPGHFLRAANALLGAA